MVSESLSVEPLAIGSRARNLGNVSVKSLVSPRKVVAVADRLKRLLAMTLNLEEADK